MFHYVPYTLAKNLRNEKSAVEQDGIYTALGGGRAAQKLGKMARDGRVRHIRKSELAKDALLFHLGLSRKIAGRQESSQRKFENFFSSDGRF